jgi:hypothetical protein
LQGEEVHHVAVIMSNPEQSKHLETARMKARRRRLRSSSSSCWKPLPACLPALLHMCFDAFAAAAWLCLGASLPACCTAATYTLNHLP